MFRVSQGFFNYLMMGLSFLLAVSQLLIYLTNYPNSFLHLKAIRLFQLQDPERYPLELTLGFGGFFLIMSIVFATLWIEGNKPLDKGQYKIVSVYAGTGGLMIYANYFPLATLILLVLIIAFGFLAKPEGENRT